MNVATSINHFPPFCVFSGRECPKLGPAMAFRFFAVAGLAPHQDDFQAVFQRGGRQETAAPALALHCGQRRPFSLTNHSVIDMPSNTDRPAPLALMAVAKHTLRRDEDEILESIAELRLVAFDLRSAGAKKAFVAIWTPSLLNFKHSDTSPVYSANHPGTAVVVSHLFPGVRPWLRLREVAQGFCVTRHHLHTLIRGRLLVASGGDTISKAPLISRLSIAELLEKRRMPCL
jgi:hypothetical protein